MWSTNAAVPSPRKSILGLSSPWAASHSFRSVQSEAVLRATYPQTPEQCFVQLMQTRTERALSTEEMPPVPTPPRTARSSFRVVPSVPTPPRTARSSFHVTPTLSKSAEQVAIPKLNWQIRSSGYAQPPSGCSARTSPSSRPDFSKQRTLIRCTARNAARTTFSTASRGLAQQPRQTERPHTARDSIRAPASRDFFQSSGIVTLDAGSPRLKLFGAKADHIERGETGVIETEVNCKS